MAASGSTTVWADTTPPVGYLSRKALPIKRHDAEPLTREDVQFDLLHHIFSDRKAVFTNPTPGSNSLSGKAGKITFADLYISALYNSSKCSKVLKEKMIEIPAFAMELAKISLLTNVGRINTTMAFFPEMKTALRTYHPVPSLQKTNGNAQDAPRIKNCLKAALLPTETKSAPPSSPDEILERRKLGLHPPTTVVNLVFVLANHAAPLANVHFDGVLNFLDLFLPNRGLMSADRAKAFLWLAYFYLESNEGPNPFGDDFSYKYPGKAPLLRQMTEQQKRMENVDTNEEMIWGKKMSAQRNSFLQKLVNSLKDEKKTRPSSPAVRGFVSGPSFAIPPQRPLPRVVVNESTLRRPKQPHEEGPFMYYVPQGHSPPDTDSPKKTAPLQLQSHPHQSRHILAPPVSPSHPQARTMLQQAWHVVTTTDPLADSDDDLEHADEHVLVDYTRRMRVLSHIEKTVFRPRHSNPDS